MDDFAWQSRRGRQNNFAWEDRGRRGDVEAAIASDELDLMSRAEESELSVF
jgi:hypothetical protein